MAGFETIVRPVVFPNIRPTPKQGVRLQESSSGDPEKGMCVIRGTSGKTVSLSYSYSASSSSNNNRETQRRVDEMRVFQENDDGTINRDNFIDIKVANKIWKEGSKRPAVDTSGAGFGTPGVGGTSGGFQPEKWTERYKKVEEKPNIEIRKTNQIEKNIFQSGTGQ